MPTAAITVLLLLVATAVFGCTSDSEEDPDGTTVEVVVTDEASGKPAADVEAGRASKIKSYIDSSDVVKLFPPTVVLDGDVAQRQEGTPARALLEWWQAFQFRDPMTVIALTSQSTLKEVGRRELAELVRRTGLPGIEILDVTRDGDAAVIQAALLNFSSPKGEPPPRTPTGSQPATFAMTSEDGEWVLAQTDFLALRVANLDR